MDKKENARTVSADGMEASVTIVRVFDAPRELVFKAWTEPEHLARWWGPECWTNPTCDVDLRPGGKWRIVMRSPDGDEYPCGGVYKEIVEPRRLVFTNIAYDAQEKPLLDGLTKVTFEDADGKTRLTLETNAKGLVEFAPQMLAGMEAGWTQSLVKLEELVKDADREIVISRTYDAPRELLWGVWTDPKHLVHWFGPNGFRTTMEKMDVRPGGEWKFVMHGPDGCDYDNYYVFVEVVRPERLVYDHVLTPKFRSMVTFEARGAQTKLTLRTVFPTAAERDHMVKEVGAIEGGKQTLARLAEFVAEMEKKK